MPSNCIFEFDRPQPIYYSGEVIKGRVILQTTTIKSVNAVYISFEGQAKVRWEEQKTDSSNDRTGNTTEYYSGTEKYISMRTTLHGSGNLAPGTHTYTFCIPLPPQCPTSCVEKYGKISYELSLVLDRSWRFNNEFTQTLTVLHTYNLNLHPQCMLPIKEDDIKYFCCWPCSSGPVISTLTIPFSGYAPGQSVNYKLEIDNQSQGNDLDGIELSLVQIYRFVAQTPTHKLREHSNTLARGAQGERVLRLSKRILTGVMSIPPIPPSSQDQGIVTVRYYLLMAIKTGSCHTDSKIMIPLTIGTIPLAQSARNPSHIAAWIPQIPQVDGNRLPPNYDEYAPPSFQEATNIGDKFIDTDKDAQNRNNYFMPKYPMYTNFSMPSAPPPDTLLRRESTAVQPYPKN